MHIARIISLQTPTLHVAVIYVMTCLASSADIPVKKRLMSRLGPGMRTIIKVQEQGLIPSCSFMLWCPCSVKLQRLFVCEAVMSDTHYVQGCRSIPFGLLPDLSVLRSLLREYTIFFHVMGLIIFTGSMSHVIGSQCKQPVFISSTMISPQTYLWTD